MLQSPLMRSKSMSNRMMRLSRARLVLAATGLLLIVVLLLVVLSRDSGGSYYGCDARSHVVYDVVMDAGSTGSRVHIFQFERKDDELRLEKEFFHRTQPGLSSFADNPDGAVASVRVLLDVAMAHVPASYQRCTSVTLKATAGLRLLPQAQSQCILDRVRQLIERGTPFSSRGVSIISGNEEGVYAWLTVNYLMDRLFSTTKPSVAIMDMGGASTQLVFETDEEDGDWVPYNYVSRLRINDRRITLYHHSYLGFGLNEARRRVYHAVASGGTSATADAFACFPAQFTLETDGKVLIRGGSSAGVQNFDQCRHAVASAVLPGWRLSQQQGAASCGFRRCGIAGIPQPALIPADHDILAFSYFFDRLEPFLPSQDGGVSVGTLKRIGKDVCDSASHPHNRETVCLDFAYLYTYLHDGLQLADTTPLLVQEKISGKSVSWSLGASLLYLLHADA